MRGKGVLLAIGVTCATALPQAALAQQQQERTVTAIGAASTEVTPTDRTDNLSIRSAIEAARTAGVAPALTASRARADLFAQAAGGTLGPIRSIVDDGVGPGFHFGGGGWELGSFGPGQYCGIVLRYVTRRGPGKRIRRVRRGSRRVCRFPNTIETRLSVTYAVQ